MSTILKPCPFCGGTARLLEEKEGFYTERVICDSCEFCLERSAVSASERWNRRATLAEAKYLNDPRLQQLFGDAIEGALAFGFQGNNKPPEGHWLWRFWNIGEAEHSRAAPQQPADRFVGANKMVAPGKIDAPRADADEDAFVIQRLSQVLAGVAIALKGDEAPLHRHSYHDLPELAETLKLELDLYRATFPNGVPGKIIDAMGQAALATNKKRGEHA